MYVCVCMCVCVCVCVCVYACMPIRRLVHATFNPPLLYVRSLTHKYTRIHLHTHIHTLTCRQIQAFDPPCVTRTYTCVHLRAHAHTCTYTHATHALTRLLEKGVRISYVLGQAWQWAYMYIGAHGTHTLGHTIRRGESCRHTAT